MRNKQLLPDAEIISRVRRCLERNANGSSEFGNIVRQLQAKHPEYRRRKQGPFRQLVKQALRIINPDVERPNNEDSFPSEIEEVHTKQPKANIMGSLLNNMYNRVKTPKQHTTTGGDAITISNDQSQVASVNSDSRKSVDPSLQTSLDVDTMVSPANEVPSMQQPFFAGQKLTENSSTSESPAKKTTTRKQRVLDEHQNSEEYTSVRNDDFDIATEKTKPNRQAKSKAKTMQSSKREIKLENSVLNFQHLGGIDNILKELCQILIHFKTPEIYNILGVVPPKGILIYGTSGCGKTCLAYAIAGQLKIPVIHIPATELIAGVAGESEERIRDIFEQAAAASPCVLFLDDVEAISSSRMNAQKDMERRIVSQLISCIDELTNNGSNVLLIGATTRPDAIDSALRRAGRFDHEIAIPIPNRKQREKILRIMCEGLQVEPDFDYDMIAELTPGYVGADFSALVSRASLIAVKRQYVERLYNSVVRENGDLTDGPEYNFINEDSSSSSSSYSNSPNRPINPMVMNLNEKMDEDEKEEEKKVVERQNRTKNARPCNWQPTLTEMIGWLDNPPENMSWSRFCISFRDFKSAIKVLQPSSKREGFLTVPDITWDDIGSLRDIQEELRLAILAPVKYTNEMARLGLSAPSGVLLCGPPGCGKTLIAKAIANEAGINFLSVKGPELMNMYVGESERAVRDCFQRARNSAPCVIFFDEFDSLCPKRSDAHEGSSGIRVVNQLLTEMDGIEERKGVYIMAASNRPDIIDPAILRPGRLDTILYVGLPNERDRIEILNAATKNRSSPMLGEDVNFAELANRTEGFTGADLSGMVRKAAMLSLKDSIANQTDPDKIFVGMNHFLQALQQVRPSISERDRKMYERMREKYAAPRFAA